ncbi:MAG: pyrC 2, partial [Evtepia sp.]|nr:pyrC 2 [Evtepia sp.]
MKYLLSGLLVCTADGVRRTDIFIDHGRIAAISPMIPASIDTTVIHLKDCYLFPGFVDVHVHLREPGFSYKETVETGTLAAARGGFTTICT